MAIQSLLPTTLPCHVGDRKLGLISSRQERVYSGETVTERPMSQRLSASSENSLPDKPDSAKSSLSFSENPPHEMPSWKTSQEFYSQVSPDEDIW